MLCSDLLVVTHLPLLQVEIEKFRERLFKSNPNNNPNGGGGREGRSVRLLSTWFMGCVCQGDNVSASLFLLDPDKWENKWFRSHRFCLVGVRGTSQMIRKESFKRIKVMLMFKLALSLIRKCAGTAFPNDEGFFLFFSRKVSLCALWNNHFILYVIYEGMAICLEKLKSK